VQRNSKVVQILKSKKKLSLPSLPDSRVHSGDYMFGENDSFEIQSKVTSEFRSDFEFPLENYDCSQKSISMSSYSSGTTFQ
jgi:hypothetical protein